MNLGAALFGSASDLHRAGVDAHAVLIIPHFDDTILREAALEVDGMHLAIASHHQAQPLAECIHATDAHAVQATADLVAVLVELAARMQLGQSDLGRAALGLVLVVHLHPGGDAAAVVNDADAVVTVDGDDDVVAMPGQGFIDGVVHHFEHQVVQTGAVGRIADVHPRPLAHGLQSFEDLNAAFSIRLGGLVAGRGVMAFGRRHVALRNAVVGAGLRCF